MNKSKQEKLEADGWRVASDPAELWEGDSMQQFNFMLTDRQRQRLEEEASYLDISLPELVRRIIDVHYERKARE